MISKSSKSEIPNHKMTRKVIFLGIIPRTANWYSNDPSNWEIETMSHLSIQSSLPLSKTISMCCKTFGKFWSLSCTLDFWLIFSSFNFLHWKTIYLVVFNVFKKITENEENGKMIHTFGSFLNTVNVGTRVAKFPIILFFNTEWAFLSYFLTLCDVLLSFGFALRPWMTSFQSSIRRTFELDPAARRVQNHWIIRLLITVGFSAADAPQLNFSDDVQGDHWTLFCSRFMTSYTPTALCAVFEIFLLSYPLSRP